MKGPPVAEQPSSASSAGKVEKSQRCRIISLSWRLSRRVPIRELSFDRSPQHNEDDYHQKNRCRVHRFTPQFSGYPISVQCGPRHAKAGEMASIA